MLADDDERTDPDAPTPIALLVEETRATRRAAERTADVVLDLAARMARLEATRLWLPWAAIAVAALASLVALVR